MELPAYVYLLLLPEVFKYYQMQLPWEFLRLEEQDSGSF